MQLLTRHLACRYDKLLTLVHAVNGASLLVGGPGTAKTCMINQFLAKFSSDVMASKTITFSSLTTPQIFQMSIEGKCAKSAHEYLIAVWNNCMQLQPTPVIKGLHSTQLLYRCT